MNMLCQESRGGVGSGDVIRVVVVEDDRMTREGLSLIISGAAGYQCAATFGSVEEALAGLGPHGPQVMLLDIHLPGMLGSEGVRVFKARYPSSQILMLTIYAEQEKIFESICNGACGYLLKKTPPAKLLEAIREAHEGGSPMSPVIARKVITLFRQVVPPPQADYQLTPQETRLLKLLAEGYSYQSSAGRLNISINTVRNYIRSIYDKLHVSSKSEAVSKALRSRLIS
jgi:DNA-binding NarL/FixJ family response regulator